MLVSEIHKTCMKGILGDCLYSLWILVSCVFSLDTGRLYLVFSLDTGRLYLVFSLDTERLYLVSTLDIHFGNLWILCIIFTGEDVTGGVLKVTITIDGITILTEKLDLCQVAPDINLMCPLKSGVQVASISVTIPSGLPKVRVQRILGA